MYHCDNCYATHRVLVQVKIYLGQDEHWGHQFTSNWWCLPCIQEYYDQSQSSTNATQDGRDSGNRD